ncbi:hypothetical protein K3495_g10561 [Podosphaera aphanis]|nr:hypothetical protein K3495_g10561 [Podosphaera aphanis]
MPKTSSILPAPGGKSDKNSLQLSRSRSSTPATKSGAQACLMDKKNEHDRAENSDIECIRALVTCSICDQLLYEPWTIACGHTYCYSCLCSWFCQDKRNKSCPECRSRVEAMPAPSFLIKQLVDVVLVRSKFTDIDESVEQHQKKKLEEIALVDKDKNSSQGLFQGMFAKAPNKLWRDDSDGVLRCPGCGFEHEGGRICTNCGEEIDDEDNVYDLDEVDMESTDYESMGFTVGVDSDEDSFYHDNHLNHLHRNFHNPIYGEYVSSRRLVGVDSSDETESEANEASSASNSSRGDTDVDEENSMHDFIVPDDEDDFYNTTTTAPTSRLQNNPSSSRHQNSVTISDDDSDEGGAISNRRQRRRYNNSRSVNMNTMSPVPSVMTITDVSTVEFECDDHGNEAESVSFAGWSPLDLGDNSEEDNRQISSHYLSGNNDIRTEIMDDESDENDADEGDDNFSETPTYQAPSHHSNYYMYRSSNRDYPECNDSSFMDIDEDTDMSASPHASKNCRIISANGFNSRMSSVGASLASISQKSSSSNISTEYEADNTRRRNWQNHTRSNQNSIDSESRGINRTRRTRHARETLPHSTLETNPRRNGPWSSSTMQNSYQRESSHESLASRTRADSVATDDHSNLSSNSSGENLGEVNEIHELDEESDDSIQPLSRRRLRQRSSNSRSSSHQVNLASNQELSYESHTQRPRNMLPGRINRRRSSVSPNVSMALATPSRPTKFSRNKHNKTSLYH